MGAACLKILKNLLQVAIAALVLVAAPPSGTEQSIAQTAEHPQNPTSTIEDLPSPKAPARTVRSPRGENLQEQDKPESVEDPQNQPSEKAEPTVEPQPAPPTDAEKKLVQRLLDKADAPQYLTRRSAQLELIKLGERLPVILAEVGRPDTLEAKAAVGMALRRLDDRNFIEFSWRLTPTAKKGEKLGLGPSTITFNRDKSFVQSGPSAPEPETWTFDMTSKKLILDFNGGFAIYTGFEDEDGNFSGTAKNSKQEWDFKLERIGRQK